MGVETRRGAWKLEKLKADENLWHPPPTSWESIPSESGFSLSSSSPSSIPPSPLYQTPIVSESSLIRLAINALQGMESALLTIKELCTAFDSEPSDRTFLRTPSIWKRTSSTLALGRILKAIGCSGCIVFLLRKFVDYFGKLHLDGSWSDNNITSIVPENNQKNSKAKAENLSPSAVRHAFSVAVQKLLEGYLASVDTLYASVNLRRSMETVDVLSCSSFQVSSVMRSEYSEVTLLEVYLHSKELRTQIEVIGNICQIQDIAVCFTGACLEDLVAKAKAEFLTFPTGGGLLSYLYSYLRVADPVHNALLKFLFLRTCEPYCEFIRSWIYKAEICDPYKEFMVEYDATLPSYSPGEDKRSDHIWLATVKERDGVAIPCFLKDMCIPIFRAGQQLQVLMKLLELSGHINSENIAYSDILPCWNVFSSDYSSDASSFSFDRERIEAMALARSSYYTSMMAKMDIVLKKLGARFQQVVSHGTVPAFISNCEINQDIPLSLQSVDRRIAPTVDKNEVEPIVDGLDPEASSTTVDFPFVEDQFDSSDCSSLDDSEQQNESDQFIQSCTGNGPTYLSALEMLPSICNKNSLPLTCNSDTFHPAEGDISKLYDAIDVNDLSTQPCPRETNLKANDLYHESEKPNKSWFSETQCRYSVYHKDSPFGGLVENPFSVNEMRRHDASSLSLESGLKVRARNIGVLSESLPYLATTNLMEFCSSNETSDSAQFPMRTSPSSDSFNLSILSSKCHSNPLSMNPILFKTDLIGKREKRICAEHIAHSPYFDFSSVKNPCKIHENSSPASRRHKFGPETNNNNPNAYAVISSSKFQSKDCYDGHETLREKNGFHHVNFTLASGNNKKEGSTLKNICGGSSWECMLSCFGNTMEISAGIPGKGLAAAFEIPLDFVIEKCFLQEILHQYWYISKLTIKLLEEGFNLREHLSALRRYHFMEIADWADLFIVSLWNRNWGAMEAARTVSEIQGLLAISLQKSSCEKDDYKNRLFVYMKGNESNVRPLLFPKLGIDSFDFLGLGYKVDWPISIVLTPGALKIYVQIFNFLLRVKLAIFALTDTWSLIKDLLNFKRQSLYAKARKLEVQEAQSQMQHLNTLTIVRHQVSHFVTTLQQYVQSQLSHVSYCRFTDALNNKVQDMMDLESVHMAYLVNSLHICFLSEEMKAVASIIENVLQCALDLRSCLGNKGDGQLRGGFPDKVSSFDIAQVVAVKQAFRKNLTELHMCFLKAPKQLEYGLARFWGLLNYNEHFSDLTE